MRFRDRVDSVIEFRTAVVSILTVIVYLAVAITNEWQDEPRVPPTNLRGLDLPQAFQDLKIITTRPHPYNSRSNDDVRSYILERVEKIAVNSTYVTVSDDLISNATYASRRDVVYHEGLNVIVFVNGTSPNLQDVLLSAHFDSVSTGNGATDDGMGVVSLVALLEYFSQHPPKRSLVFNINNGEEDWLNGAHVFLEHPWSKNIGTFLNLEGAGSGGRPTLFRSSNTRVTQLFKASPHPHGNVISADSFKAGLVKSGTDYQVYEGAGMKGLDFAFYRHRDLYHTKYDSVSNLEGPAPLWNMLETALATTKALTDDEGTNEDTSSPVFFDILGEGLLVVSLQTAFIFNILVLVLGPLAALTLGIFAARQSKLYWGWRGWVRFPIAVVVAVGLNIVLVFGYYKVNPFVGYSAERSLLVSFSTLTVLSLYGILRPAIQFYPIPCQRHIILIEYYIFWWMLLVVHTVFIHNFKLSGLFPIAFFHGGALLAVLIGLLEVFLFKPKTPNADLPTDIDDPNVETAIVVERASPPPRPTNHGPDAGDDDGVDATEQTPLLVTRRKVVGLKSEIYNEKQAGGMWFWQFIAEVPFPALFISQIAYMVLFGLNGTLADGGSTLLVLEAASIFGFLIAFPLAAFVHKFHVSLIAFILVLFVASTLYNFFVFPFSANDPLKVFFKQTVDIDSRYPINRVYLEGVDRYLLHGVVEEIPSATNSGGVWCSDHGIRPGLRSCRWSGTLPRVGNGTAIRDLVKYSVLRIQGDDDSKSWARFTIKGAQDTRACRIYFESSPVYAVRVHGASNEGVAQRGYEIAKEGASIVKLWSRTWDREWVVDVDLGRNVSASVGDAGAMKVNARDKVRGRVACEWSENVDSRIPALEEIMTFVPKWAAVTKADDGLVEVYKSFEI